MPRMHPILFAILLFALPAACKRDKAPEASPEDTPAAESEAEVAPAAADTEAPVGAEAEPTAASDLPQAGTQIEPGLPVPDGWTRVSAGFEGNLEALLKDTRLKLTSPLCDEIFATLAVAGPTSPQGAKR